MNNEPCPLTGLAIGDALGMPFETHPANSPALTAWDGSFQSGATNSLQPHRQPGEWTDDTKMALALGRTLFDQETFNPLAALAAYVEWYASGDHRGIGKATKQAMDRVLTGHHWTSSGVLHASGSGTAMRVAPLGLYYRRSLITAAEMARVDARLTHRSRAAEEGSAAVAIAVALFCENLADKTEVYDAVLNLLSEGTVYGRLASMQAHMKGESKRAEVLADLLQHPPASVMHVVPAAFYHFTSTDNFKDAVESAVRAGGDTDTTAAITGALAGAYYGEEQVQPYLEQLEGAESIRHLEHMLYLSAPNIPEDV